MTFVEAALLLLEEAGRELSVQELCELALERELLSKPGKTPLRSMKARLTSEEKKGADSRVVRVAPDVWALSEAAESAAGADAAAGDEGEAAGDEATAQRPQAAARSAAVEADEEAVADADTQVAPQAEPAEAMPGGDARAQGDGTRRRRRRGRGGARRRRGAGGAGPAGANGGAEALPGESDEAAADPEGADQSGAAAGASEGESGGPTASIDVIDLARHNDEDHDSSGSGNGLSTRIAVDVSALSAEEREVAQLYSDEVDGPQVAFPEYHDEQSEDEDRPMRPEILPRRERYGNNRGRNRRGDRDRRRRGQLAEAPRGQAPEEGQAPAAGSASFDPVAAALQFMASRDGRRPANVRQLEEWMRKRGQLRGGLPRTGRAIVGALLHDAHLRAARGLRPQLSYLGKGEFALATARLGREVTVAEEAFEAAQRNLEAATLTGLQAWLRRLPLSALERAAAVYLSRTGWSDVEWIKRINRASYARVCSANSGERWMVSVYAGAQAVDRRAVGELRAGVEAKSLSAGLLLAPADLSEEAESELDAPGHDITVLSGAQLAGTLASLGIGVVAMAAPVLYLDVDFLTEIDDE
jgi:hypothetical protein